MTTLLKNAVAKAMDYDQYNALMTQLVAENRSTGEQSEEKTKYTKLNYTRSKRLDKTGVIDEDAAEFFKNIKHPQTWLVISEPWCGDAAQSLPLLNKTAQLSPNISLKIVLRDENLELMDSFLTNGTRSIPKLIVLDENYNVLTTWGPRSKEATKIVNDYKEAHGTLDETFREKIQLWYNKNKGKAIVNDLVESIKSLELV